MQFIMGEIEAGEAQAAMPTIAARQRGSRLTYYAALLLLMGAGALFGYLLGSALMRDGRKTIFDPSLTSLVGLWVGYLVYLRFCRPLLVRQFRKRMQDRDLSVRFEQTLEVDDEGLILESGGVRRIASWSVVTEVFESKGYWIFLVQMEPWFAPSRFFSSQSDEKAFIGAALRRMTPNARDRSKAAVALTSS